MAKQQMRDLRENEFYAFVKTNSSGAMVRCEESQAEKVAIYFRNPDSDLLIALFPVKEYFDYFYNTEEDEFFGNAPELPHDNII